MISAREQAVPQRIITGRIAGLGGTSGPGWVEALAFRDGRVSAAGRASDVLPLTGAGTEVWRLAPELVVMPGITDAHLHLADAALADLEVDLAGLRGVDAVLAAIAETHARMADAGDRTGWLLGRGWSLDALGGWPDRELLERVAPGRPVSLWSHDHHSRWVSREALDLAGIDAHTPDPHGGRVGRAADGTPDGLLFEDAVRLVDGCIPEPDGQLLNDAITDYARRLASLGVVGVHDPGALDEDAVMARGPRLYRQLARAGRLPLRVVASVRERQLAAAIEVGMRTGSGIEVGMRTGSGIEGRYRDGWLKLFADGALGSRSAALLQPYEAADIAGAATGSDRGMLLRTREELAALADAAAATGIAVQIHAIGDAAVRLALDVLEKTPRQADGAAHRVEHAQLVAPADVARFAAAGVAASVQPCHLINDAVAARAAWGSRVANAFPLRSLDAAGVLLPMGTDAPVEPPDPWAGIAAAVTRSSGRWASSQPSFVAEQGIDLWRAIRAACQDAARSLGITDEGHLGVGARADLLALPAPVLDEPPRRGGALETARPLATLLDGEVVHRAADFSY
jgi:predicted amidohydrolase YtcJ